MTGSGFFEHRDLPEDGANETPETVASGFTVVSEFIASYGWYILFGVIGLVYLNYWLDSRLQGWKKQRKQESEYTRYSADEVLRRQEQMDQAREKLQAKYDAEAKEYAQKQKEKEEEKRQEQIADWERHQKGLGYKSKKKVTEDGAQAAGTSTENRTKADKPKKKVRDDYNPLWGGQGSGFRPARRGFSGGGGG